MHRLFSIWTWAMVVLLATACTDGQAGTTTTAPVETTSSQSETTTAPTTTAPTTTSSTRPPATVEAPGRLVAATGSGVAIVEAPSGAVVTDLVSGELSGRAVGFGPVAVSRDGTTVYLTAVIGAHRSEIHRVTLGGTSELVTAGSDPALSPDGRKLAYTVPVPLAEGEAQALREDLVVRDRETGEERIWENAAPEDPGLLADLGSLSWSRDGGHLAFQVTFEDGTGVRVLDTSQGDSVLDARELEAPEGAAFSRPAYRGERGILAVVEGRGGVDPAIEPEAFSIVEVDPETGEVLGALVDSEGAVASLDFDPTADHLLFVTTHQDHDESVDPNRLFRWSGSEPALVPVEGEPVSAAW